MWGIGYSNNASLLLCSFHRYKNSTVVDGYEIFISQMAMDIFHFFSKYILSFSINT
jgi:hypothetical protein